VEARFAFVQLEFPWELGPPDGRYLMRGHAGEPAHVLVMDTVGATPRARRRRRARQVAPQPEPAPVAIGRATLIDAAPIDGDQPARAWLASVDVDVEAARAVATLNGVLHAHRIATADPFVRELHLEQALVTRVGYGAGEQVAEGDFTDARQLEQAIPRRIGRVDALRPDERLAALLAGRDMALAAEELTLRARLDLDRGRTREAALQLRVALEAALAELEAWSHRPDLHGRLAELREERGVVGTAANRALEGGLEPAQIDDVTRIVGRLEAALAARVAGGFE
jgi:hypothetical protein